MKSAIAMRHRIARGARAGVEKAGLVWRRMPLRWRLALASFALLAVLLGALGAVVSFAAERALLANEAAALHQEAQVALPGGAGVPSAQARELVVRLTGPNTGASVLLSDGTVLASSADVQVPIAPPPVVHVTTSAIQQTLDMSRTRATSYQLATDNNGQRELVVLSPLYVRGNPTPFAVLELNMPTYRIDHSVAAIRLIMGVGIAGALVIAALLTLPLVSATLRPLVAMERTSRRIAGGDLHLRLEVPPSEDEIGRLARSFNTMVARLEEAFIRQKQFVGDASHELRTPLTALGGGLEMLLLGADQGDAEAMRRLLRGMYGEVERMRRLVEDLLTLTRLDEGRANLRITDVDVATAVRDVCEQAQRLASGQEIVCETVAGLPPVRADPDRLRQILLNLVDNALKYTPPPGRVTLSAAAVQGGTVVAMSVRDEGSGIPPEALPHVFDRFYRADTARARSGARGGGSGLGLAIVKGLVEAQGGEVAIASESGIGTSVTLRLPASRERRALPVQPPATTPMSAPPEPVSSDT